MLSVCIPVGPYQHYKAFLKECLESVAAQTMPPHDVVIVDDMANVTPDDLLPLIKEGDKVLENRYDGKFALKVLREGQNGTVGILVRVWRSPWRLGIPACANMGIALGGTELVFQLSCDDKLLPDCLEECWKEWEHRKDPLGYYWVGVEYSTGEKQALPCGHALVPKALWRHTGGFAPELAVGACDPAFVSMMLYQKEKAGTLYSVAGGRPLYWHREHDQQYTKAQIVGPGTIVEVRDWFTKRWEPIDGKWGRYE
jgi:glycosyltransferase involved in cell wall biosynthesis